MCISTKILHQNSSLGDTLNFVNSKSRKLKNVLKIIFWHILEKFRLYFQFWIKKLPQMSEIVYSNEYRVFFKSIFMKRGRFNWLWIFSLTYFVSSSIRSSFSLQKSFILNFPKNPQHFLETDNFRNLFFMNKIKTCFRSN